MTSKPIASFFLLASLAAQTPPAPRFDMNRVRADIEFLCTPELEGRTSLERGAQISAAYVAAEFAKAKAAPAVNGSYYQEFALVEAVGEPRESRLSVGALSLRPGADFHGSFRNDATIRAGIVFAGYGITAPEYNYDDYAAIDARGKVVVVFNHEPQEGDARSVFRGTGQTRYANVRTKTINAVTHGAVALLLAPEPESVHGTPPPASRSSTRGYAPGQTDELLSIPVLTLTEQGAEKLLGLTGRSPAALQKAIDQSLKPVSTAIPGEAAITLVNRERKRAMSRNVAALVAGSDPALAGETIIVNSHYDHLPNRAGINYPGANDNGSGTAATMELARAFAASPVKPRRSVLFLSFGSEEEGLLGSYYYAGHPIKPLETTLAVLNLDMIARNEGQVPATEGRIAIPADTSNLIDLIGGSYSPDLVAAIRRANESTGLTLDDKYERDSTQNVLFRCDHFPFLLKDVPAIWIFGGFHPGYHEASDTAEKLNWVKLEKVMRLTWNTVWELDRAGKPKFEKR